MDPRTSPRGTSYRIAAPRRGRIDHRSAVTAVAGVVAGLLALSGCASPADPGDTTPPTTGPATASPTDEPTESATPTPSEPTVSGESAVWFMVDTRAGLRLARETRELEGVDVVTAAVEAMVTGPEDPDYSSPWNPATEVLGVEQTSDVVVVDLSEDARTASIGSEGAALMIQQLVHTVTDAVGDPGVAVQLLIEGEPAGELWGAVEWVEPVVRADALGTRSLVQIDEPTEGETVSSPLTVTGEAAVFEATFTWAVLDADGTEVQSGFGMTTEGQAFAPFSFEVTLEPGTWTVVVTEDDPSDGEAGTPMSDSRTVVVE